MPTFHIDLSEVEASVACEALKDHAASHFEDAADRNDDPSDRLISEAIGDALTKVRSQIEAQLATKVESAT